MGSEERKLPVGIQSFEQIVKEQYILIRQNISIHWFIQGNPIS